MWSWVIKEVAVVSLQAGFLAGGLMTGAEALPSGSERG